MNIEFQAHRLQKAHGDLIAAKAADDQMSVEAAEYEIIVRENMLKDAGFQVFADEHDVMLLAT